MIRGFVFLAAGLSLASAQTYTVTETVDACPASYSNAPSTVTVQSSVTVTPTPLTDANLNAGTPFVIQVAQYSAPAALKARAAPVHLWLTANGSLTLSNSSATQYHITGGRLFTSSGLCVSTNSSTAQTILAASPLCGAISGNFSFENDMLNWTNSAFFDGAAQFFGEYNATSNTTQVMAMLNGLLSAEQLANRLVLYGRPAVPPAAASSTVGQSSSLSSYAQPSASASLVSTPNGICGGNSGYTCAGASFGTCCSAYGYCGSSADYCGTGCQTGFGACGVSSQSVSSSSTGAMSAPGAGSTMPIYSNTTRASSSSGAASSSSMTSRLGPGPAYPDSSSMSSPVTSSLGLPAYTSETSSSTTTSSSSLSHYAGSSSTTMSSMSSSTPSTSSHTSSTTTTSYPAGYFSAPTSSSVSTTTTTSSFVYNSPSSSSSSMSSSMLDAYSSSTTVPSTATTTTSHTTSSSMTTSSMTTSSMTTTSTTTTSSPAMSATASAYMPAGNYVSTPASCPANNNTVVQDSNGIQYELMCGGDTMPGSYTSVEAANSFNDCFLSCDSDSQCMSFTYSGSVNGAMGGTCYFKTAATTLMYIDTYHVAGNRLTPRAASSGSAMSSASSSAMSFTTSSTTTTTSSRTSSTTTSTMAASSSTSSSMTIPSSSSTAVSSSTSSSSSAGSASTTSQSPTSPTAGYTSTPTPCTNFGGDPPGTDEDDAFCEIDLPFNISMYGGRGNTYQTFVSTNGLLTLYAGTDAYSSDGLPDNDQLGNYAIVPFWDDLYYYASEGDGEGIYYEINEAQTTVNYTFVLSRAESNFALWEFGVYYDSSVPGVFTYVYNAIPDSGATATVGVQGLDANNIPIGTTYSNSDADISPAPGLTVVCDTNTGICTGSNGQTASQTYVPSG